MRSIYFGLLLVAGSSAGADDEGLCPGEGEYHV